MYFQRDYVLRMIEMIGELARRVRSILREADAYTEMEEVAQRACGLPLSMLETGEPDMLLSLLDEPQRFLAAELLLIDIEVKSRKQTSDTLLPLHAQALMLYASLAEPDYMLPAADRAARLLSMLQDQLPVASLLCAAGLLERCGRYAEAEDALFAALDAGDEDPSWLLSYYDRLEAVDDQALLDGRFSRAEIAEGRAALNGRLSRPDE